MNRKLRETVLLHAQKIRMWAEVTNRRRKYPHSECLNGWCAIASARLHRELATVGVKSDIHMAHGDWGSHVFLVVDDHVVDVTSTQFSEFKNVKVNIVHHKEVEHHWFYQSSDVFETAEELREHQIRTGWPENQTAHK